MQTSTHLAGLFIFVASGCSAYLLCTRVPLSRRAIRVLAGLVIWELLQLVPVHILAGLQATGALKHVSIFQLAISQGTILSVLIAWALVHRSVPRHRLPNPERWPIYLVASAALLAASYGVFALNVFTSYPDGTDALAYHLPLAVHWLQTGSLALPASKAWRFSMPANAEIGMMLLLATGSQSSVVVVNWIALAVLVISTYVLARRVTRGNHLASAIVVLVLLSIPMVEFQTFSAYVDLFGTSFLVAAFALFLHHKEKVKDRARGEVHTVRRPVTLFLSAAACGISLGTKPVYDLYGAAYASFVIFSLWKDIRWGPRAAKSILVSLTLVTTGLLIPSMFWFARGYQATRNPLFPMRIELAGHLIFPGYAVSTITNPDFDLNFVHTRGGWLIYPWTEWKRNAGYDLVSYGEGSGLGAAFASLVPVGVAFVFYLCVRQRGRRVHLLLLVTLVASLSAWWFVLNRVPRFGLPIVVLLCIMLAPLVENLAHQRGRAFRILLVTSLAATCIISTFVPFHAMAGRIRTGRWTRAAFYNYPGVIDRIAPGSCIVNATKQEERNFSLAGATLSNCVVPGFETPADLTPQFLRENNVDYIAEIVPKNTNGFDPSRFPQLKLLRDEVIKADQYSIRWRIWALKPLGPAVSASSYLRNR